MSAHRRITAFPTTPAEIPDEATMVELLDACERRLYAVARLILRDVHLAEDAVQETLIAAWQQLPRLRDADKFDSPQPALLRLPELRLPAFGK